MDIVDSIADCLVEDHINLMAENKRLREKLRVSTEALDTGIVSLKTGYPEYDENDTLEILSEALAKIREE